MPPNASAASGDMHQTFGGADERSVPTQAWASGGASTERPAVTWGHPRFLPVAAGGGVQVVGADGPRDADGVSHTFWSQKPSDPPAYAATVASTLV